MRISVRDVRLFFEVFGQEWAFTGSTMERHPALIGLHGGPGLDGTKLRYQLALADVAQVVDADPMLDRLRVARIETVDVNLHFHARRQGDGSSRPPRRGALSHSIILGAHDPLVPIRLGQEMVEAIPDGLARLELIPEAAHA